MTSPAARHVPAGPGRISRAGDRVFPAALMALVLAGFLLRVRDAGGALWLDEAWSAVFAREADGPAGVFFAINHDNNHHLNTLWLQLVGWGGPPLAQRALSMASGTLSIVVAGLIGARRSRAGGIVAGGLFALSPILVTYGAEARGYAPMLLALLVAILLVDRWLTASDRPPPARALGAAIGIGMLAHLTMLYGLVLLAAWTGVVLVRERPPLQALRMILRLMGRAMLAALAVIGIVGLAAWASPEGFRVGSYRPFSPGAFLQGVDGMLAYAIGFSWSRPPLLVLATLLLVPLALWRMPSLGLRRPFYLLAIIGLPLGIALAGVGNSYIARYYLVTGVALLLLIADVAGRAIDAGGRPARLALLALGLTGIGSIAIDATLIANLRADPAAAIAAMRERQPQGATILADDQRETAVLEAAAAPADYPLHVTIACGEAQFLFIDREGSAPFRARPLRCGHQYRPLARRYAHGLSGMHWELYERAL